MGSSVPLTLAGYYNRDFGCGFTQYFRTDWPVSITNINPATEANIQLYPNPAQESVNINIDGVQSVNGTIQILDAAGRSVLSLPCTSAHTAINTGNLANGIYHVIFSDKANNAPRLQTRLVIAK
jgi:hypothetical protein